MMLLTRSYNGQLKADLLAPLLTIWTVTMIVAPAALGAAVLLGQRRFLARLIGAIVVLPLMPAELGLAVNGLLIIVVGSVRGDGQRLTIGIAMVAIALVLVGMTNLLLRYISKPCDRLTNAVLPS